MYLESVNFKFSCKAKDGNAQIRIPKEATKQCRGKNDTEFKVSFYHSFFFCPKPYALNGICKCEKNVTWYGKTFDIWTSSGKVYLLPHRQRTPK